jgi:hypothetical protein
MMLKPDNCHQEELALDTNSDLCGNKVYDQPLVFMIGDMARLAIL